MIVDMNILSAFMDHRDKPFDASINLREYDFTAGFHAGEESVPKDLKEMHDKVIAMELEIASYSNHVLVDFIRYEDLIETEAKYQGLCK